MLIQTVQYTGLSAHGYPCFMPTTQMALFDMPRNETMGHRIRKLREARNLTQQQLAIRCGVAKSAVAQWELGTSENIKLQPWLRLLRALNVTAHYLLFGSENPPKGFWLEEEVADYESKRRGNGGDAE